MPGFLMSMRVFYDGDTFPSLPGGWKTLDWLVSSNLRWNECD
jgi:hypothetical protein